MQVPELHFANLSQLQYAVSQLQYPDSYRKLTKTVPGPFPEDSKQVVSSSQSPQCLTDQPSPTWTLPEAKFQPALDIQKRCDVKTLPLCTVQECYILEMLWGKKPNDTTTIYSLSNMVNTCGKGSRGKKDRHIWVEGLFPCKKNIKKTRYQRWKLLACPRTEELFVSSAKGLSTKGANLCGHGMLNSEKRFLCCRYDVFCDICGRWL